MRTRFLILIAIVSANVITTCFNVKAQAPEAKIMDTTIEWMGDDGQLKVFLTNTEGVTGLRVTYGSADSIADYFQGEYAIPGSFELAGGRIEENVLSLPIGSFAEPVVGYLRVTVLMEGDIETEIAVVK